MTTYDMSDIQSDLVTLGVFVLRRVVSIYLRVRRMIWSDPDAETVKRTCHVASRVLEDGDKVPNPIVLETWTRHYCSKSWVQYVGETIVDHSSPFTAPYHPPWYWIGYKTISGDMIDLTNEMAQFVVAGNVIKPDLMHTMFPRSETGLLQYIDRQTFELKDLSSDGLVIEDAIPPPPPSPAPELVPDSGRVRASSEHVGTTGVDGNTSTVD